MTPAGSLTTLVQFTGNGTSNKGSLPSAGLVQGSDGNFYGTTKNGGAGNFGYGTVFRMTPTGVLTTLVDFTNNGTSNKGSEPKAELVQASDGNFYGTTSYGGLGNFGDGNGTVFRMTSAGVLTTLVEFTGNGTGTSNKGFLPSAGLVKASDGSFYSTTAWGGNTGNNGIGSGTVFRMTAAGVLMTLVEFTDNGTSNKGRNPYAGLVQGSDGNFYGTTFQGGANDEGTVFRMTTDGVPTTLVEFTGNGPSNRGRLPYAGLVQGSDGNFYGTTRDGGTGDNGTIFRMTSTGVLTTLVEFTDNGTSNKGRLIQAGLVQGSDGNFYGTTRQGGANNVGTVFRMTPAGVLTTLVEFTGNGTSNKGSEPFAGMVQGSDGNFYGTTRLGGANNVGTVFRMTPAGVLTTLVEFTGNGTSNKGNDCRAGMVQGSDGNFYGTTRLGGANNVGTVFRMTPDGVLTTLVQFTGNGTSNKGSLPSAGLVQGSDGNFYCTTDSGGANDAGTVFRMTPAGVLTTIFDFAGDPVDSRPRAPLSLGSDGNFYGTASGGTGTGDGSVYRLVIPGLPNIFLLEPDVKGNSSALIAAKVNARGASTTVSLEYGDDGVVFANTLPVAVALTGFQTSLVGTTLGGLSAGATYYYRFIATSSSGITVSPVASFSTLAEPTATTIAASAVTPTSARFNGTVNARNFDTTAVFEWGTDGNSFPNVVPATVAGVTPPTTTVSGNAPVAVSAAVAGLVSGHTYFFRVVATNAAGTVVSGTQTFTTLTESVASVTGAFGLNTTSARVFGTVNARGSVTGAVFEYGTDGVSFPSSVATDPASVSGETDVAVSATLTNLSQGTTYHYRIRATSDGGVGLSAEGTFDLGVLSGFQQVAPLVLDPRPGAQGFLVVNLSPSNLTGTGWRFVGEQQWRVPGVPAGGLATGNREIEFRPVAGFLHPLREPVSVTSGAAATTVEREYFQGGGAATASLSVTLLPVSLGAAAQWRLLGEGDSAWRASGASLGGLAAGVYLVECKDVAGYTTPRPISVTIGSGVAKTATATYFLADAAVGTQPGVVGFDAVTSATANPFTYVGQLRSDSGSGTGFVVRQRVVATAAHVVFDDGTLSAATGVQWVFQRERGTYEPVPQIPRGSYILTGYSAQRIADATPGTSSVAAQNLDVASVWFYEQDAGRGGSGGYLASDSTDNEWLISPRLKTIVGYPLDGISAANQGRIHATPPINATFTHANARVYLTDNITSRGGTSGGPVCVQYDDGRYFPAAIYLGGTTQTRVRAIDSDVITLFDSAEESSTTGQNSTNGGSTQTNNSLGSTPSGMLTVTIEPQAARAAGAGWRIGSGAFLTSGQSKPYLSAGDYTVTFKSIEGFQTPSTRTVTVEAGKTVRIAITYSLPSTAGAPSAVAVPTYSGIIIGTEGVAGQVVAGITKTKRLTLKIRIGAESLMLTGVLDASGTFSGSILRREKEPALVTLAFDPDLVAQLTGKITLDGISYDLSAGKSPFQTKSPTSLAGKYTFVFPRDPGFIDPTTRPFGTGYALGTVSSSGAVNVAGVLGDGTAFAFSAPLFADATCPVYVQPYAKTGLLAGTLVFHDATTPDIAYADGTLLWQKPATSKGLYKAGFTGSIAALGSRWTAPAKNTAALDITNWNLAIGNGVLVPPLTGTVTLSPANLFIPPVPGTKLTLAPKTGLLSGSFPGASGKPVKFNGALLQSQRIGRGVFALPDKTGPVTLDPP